MMFPFRYINQMKNCHPCHLNLMIGVFGILTMVIVSVFVDCQSCNFEAYTNSNFDTAVRSHDVEKSGIALLVSVCPLLLDLLMDIFSGSKLDLTSEQSKQNYIYRTSIGFASLLFGLHIAAQGSYVNVITHNYAASSFFEMCAVRLILGTCTMSYLHAINPELFSLKQTTLFSAFTVLFTTLRFFGASSNIPYIIAANRAIPFVTLVVFIYLFTIWLSKMWYSTKAWNPDDYKCLYVLSLLIFVALAAFAIPMYVTFTTGSKFIDILRQSTSLNVSCQLYIFAASVIIMSIIPGRIARVEALATKDNVIKTKEDYVRFISHELRTPLNTVSTGIKVSLDQIPANTTDATELEQISVLTDTYGACNVAIEILNDLLFYDKLQNGLITVTKTSINVWSFMSDCAKLFKVHFRSKKLRFVMSPNSRLNEAVQTRALCMSDCIEADKAKLGQVVRNLLSNAIKFTPDGGDIQVNIAVHPSDTNSKGAIIIEATDIGTGISKKNQERLFREIVQFQPEVLQAGGGSGLGMYITKRLVDLHGGSISVHSEGEGKGTTFRVELTWNAVADSAATGKTSEGDNVSAATRSHIATSDAIESLCLDFHEELSKSNTSESTSQTKTLSSSNSSSSKSTRSRSCSSSSNQTTNQPSTRTRLLLVDDSGMSRKMTRRALEAKSYVCDEAEDGQVAVDMMSAILKNPQTDASINNYDAIFMDYMMPIMNGPLATEEIRRLGYRGLIIGLTGNVLADDKARLINAGCNAVLTKPATTEQIIDTLTTEFARLNSTAAAPKSSAGRRTARTVSKSRH